MRGLVFALLCLWPALAVAEDRVVQLYAPPALIDSGLIKHIVPRFALKHGIRVVLNDDPAAVDLVLGDAGRAIFSGQGRNYAMDLRRTGHPGTEKFAKWLTSDVGTRTIYGFAPGGEALFGPPEVIEIVRVEAAPDGDAELGRSLSHSKCGRCHTTERGRGMGGIGSTPSFFVLRSFADWQDRFEAFYALKPHGAFTQVAEVTPPFPMDRPSPIAPVEITLDELEAILAYVSGLEAADLGAPLAHQ